jgi:hypothetical protein
MFAISLYQPSFKAIYEYIPLLLSKNYVAIAAALQRLQAVFFLCTVVVLRYSTVRVVLPLIILMMRLYLTSGALGLCSKLKPAFVMAKFFLSFFLSFFFFISILF